jgi:hypothetical protein
MALRLVVSTEHGQQRFVLREGETVVGSDPASDVHIAHPSVSQRHARIAVSSGRAVLRDLASSNGTTVGSRRVNESEVKAGVPLYFGRVPAVLEEVAEADLEVGIAFPGSGAMPASTPAPAVPGSTVSFEPVAAFVLDELPRLLRRLLNDREMEGMAQAVGQALFVAVPCLALDIGDGPGEAVRFTARAEGVDVVDAGEERTGACAGVAVRARFQTARLADAYAPLLETAAALVALGDAPRARRPRPERPAGVPPPPPDPPSLEASMRRVYDEAAKVARGDVSVLITGESGTGKELLARYLHTASSRADGPFVALNCAALPRDLLEVELFGIERGVATGVDSRPGKFELADGGTLFLDEIGDMAPETQASILRVLQERQVYRLGGREPHAARIRVVAATNRDLTPMIEDGRFRTDLYHRIATWVVELPPLRERRADIPNLAAFFLAREAARHGRRVGGLSRGAVDALTAFDWPGNVRQLEHEMARAVLFLEPGEMLDTMRLHPDILGRGPNPSGKLEAARASAERDEIISALQAHGGDVSLAAERLGISRATAYRRIKSLAIDPSTWQ